jgi:hypothetical protein
LKLKCYEPLSNFAFNFNVRRYTEGGHNFCKHCKLFIIMRDWLGEKIETLKQYERGHVAEAGLSPPPGCRIAPGKALLVDVEERPCRPRETPLPRARDARATLLIRVISLEARSTPRPPSRPSCLAVTRARLPPRRRRSHTLSLRCE